MKKILLFIVAVLFVYFSEAQDLKYTITNVMIPMRDGKKLFTVIVYPSNAKTSLPFLVIRTPYSASVSGDYNILETTNYGLLAKGGYIFVFQDIRGKFKSEGYMEIHQPLVSASSGGVDEGTDVWDTIDWLVKHVQNNNGKAGLMGISYPGWEALVGAVNPHPAIKAVSPQGTMGDLFLNDDFHHNGAFRLSYAMEYSYEVEYDRKQDSDFPFPQFDLFDWYLQLGSLKNVNSKYFHNRVPSWNHFVQHPNYDSFWQKQSPLNYVHYPAVPHLHVGGYYDQEDLNGPQLMYHHLEKKDTFNRNYLVLGPWYHGQWGRLKGDSISKIDFGSATGEWFRVLQKKWFDYWLKNTSDGKFDEATCFQTGSNQWQSFARWPPASTIKKLYVGVNNTCSFVKPSASKGSVSFVSDPSHPVPYRMLPIEATYGHGSRWKPWQVEDQRFVYTRPDVVSFTSDSLKSDLVITGRINAHLFAATSGTDADWIVKLIDVYPANDPVDPSMSQYQFPVAMEVLRGRFRKSFEKPSPLVPGKPEEFIIDLHEVNHVFRKGHRMMIQVQSTWFPVIDRNPQKYIPNIFEAKETDFTKATHTIYFSSQYPTYIELPVMTGAGE